MYCTTRASALALLSLLSSGMVSLLGEGKDASPTGGVIGGVVMGGGRLLMGEDTGDL